MTNKKEDDRIVLVNIERTGHMIPYYEEYCKLIENNPSLEPYKRRLSALDKAEKNLLEMKAEEIAQIIDVDKKKINTIQSTYSTLRHYQKWVNENYGLPIADSYYEIQRLKTLVSSNKENIRKIIFNDFSELKSTLSQAEENYLMEMESELSEKKYDTLVKRQKQYSAYIVFLWNQMPEEDMLKLSLKDIETILDSKQLNINNSNVTLSDAELIMIREAYDVMIDMRDQDKEKQIRGRGVSSKFKCDNLFNTTSLSKLRNLKWEALGSSTDDIRLEKPSIKKAGLFNKIYQYEQKNDYTFVNTMDGYKAYCEIFNETSRGIAQRNVNEYISFRKGVENLEDLNDI